MSIAEEEETALTNLTYGFKKQSGISDLKKKVLKRQFNKGDVIAEVSESD